MPDAKHLTIAEHLEASGVSRRNFIQLCGMLMAIAPAGLALTKGNSVLHIADIVGKAKRPSVVWLHFQDCTGCTETLLRTSAPDAASLILDVISLDYHETLMAASGAQAELTRVAELLGAEVWGADSSEVNISATHPLFKDQLGHMFGEHSRAITSRADVVLICGTYVFPEVFPALSGVFAPGAKVIHIDLNAYEVAKNFPVDLGLISDPKTTLARLAAALGVTMTPEHKAAASARISQCAAAREQEVAAQREADRGRRDAVPLHPSRAELVRVVYL